MNKPILTFAISLAITVSGCVSYTSSGPDFKQETISKTKGLFYCYRKDLGSHQGSYNPSVYIDGEISTVLRRETYWYAYLEPGNHTVNIKHNFLSGHPNAELQLTVEAGKTYCVKYSDPYGSSAGITGMNTTYTSILGIIPNINAMKELESTRLIQLEK